VGFQGNALGECSVKIKIKSLDNLIPYSSSCMGFDSDVRIRLNNGETVELDSIPLKGTNYVKKITSTKKGSEK